MLWYLTAYATVTLIGIFHTIFNGIVLKCKFMDATETRMKDIEVYAKTMLWHPLYNLTVFHFIAWKAIIMFG